MLQRRNCNGTVKATCKTKPASWLADGVTTIVKLMREKYWKMAIRSMLGCLPTFELAAESYNAHLSTCPKITVSKQNSNKPLGCLKVDQAEKEINWGHHGILLMLPIHSPG
jgi:hypothetical protein